MDRRDVRLLVGLAAVSAALLLAFAAGAVGTVFLYAVPAALLAVPLLGDRFFGESRIERIRRSCRRPRRRRAARLVPLSALRTVVLLPRGGRLVASALAVRPPPVASATT